MAVYFNGWPTKTVPLYTQEGFNKSYPVADLGRARGAETGSTTYGTRSPYTQENNSPRRCIAYSPFHKTLPKCSLLTHWISVRYNEMGR